jgi:hypothetical protein
MQPSQTKARSRRMKPISDTQENVRRFNEDEAVWRRFEQKRLLRDPFSALPEEVLDEIDWREAERECRQLRYAGRPHV